MCLQTIWFFLSCVRHTRACQRLCLQTIWFFLSCQTYSCLSKSVSANHLIFPQLCQTYSCLSKTVSANHLIFPQLCQTYSCLSKTVSANHLIFPQLCQTYSCLSKTVSANHLIFPQLCQTYSCCQACWCVHCKSPYVKTTWQETIPLLRPLSGSWLSFTYMDPTARTALLVKTTVAGLLGWSLNRRPVALLSNKMVSYYRHLKVKSVMSHKAPSQSDHHRQ